MSALYNLEPQPTAKVILNTTAGDIELELFGKQTPVTTRNFLQLCFDGYYDGTIFHRLVPGFIIQGGDPTGTGSGGESSLEDGRPFEDEFHSRLRFNRRGLLGMANSGPDDNSSQFFLTLGDTPELQGKNTMFGRVMGDTIYNLMKMGEGELAGPESDRPLYPYKVKSTEILVNPYEDMVKRDLRKRVATSAVKDRKKTKRKAGKAILSFGGDEEDEDGIAPVIKKPKFNPQLVDDTKAAQSKPAVKQLPTESKPTPISDQDRKPPPKRKSPSPEPPPRRDQILSGLAREPPKRSTRSPSESESGSDSESDMDLPSTRRHTSTSNVSKMNAEIEALKASMRRTGPATAAPAKKKSVLEAMIPETSTRGRRRGAGKEDANAMKLFAAFKSKLESAPAEALRPDDDKPTSASRNGTTSGKVPDDVPADEDEAALCDLHFVANCQSCTRWDQDEGNQQDEDDDGEGWMSHKLSFAKDRLGKDLEWKRKNEEELLVIDPRERERDLGVGQKKKGRAKEDERAPSTTRIVASNKQNSRPHPLPVSAPRSIPISIANSQPKHRILPPNPHSCFPSPGGNQHQMRQFSPPYQSPLQSSTTALLRDFTTASYLQVSHKHKQPLCGNQEGWGPLSPLRWDFTPCFLDVWICAVGVFGLLGGLGAIIYLRKQEEQPVGRNWHFWAKLAVILGVIADFAAQAVLQIQLYEGIWFGDFRFWATIVALVSLGVILYVQYIEHWRSRNANGVVLFYWLFLLLASAVKLRSLVSQEIHKEHVVYFSVFCIGVGLAAVEFSLEWLVPKKLSAYDALGDEFECPYNYANVFSILTFSWMTPMMKYGYKHFLTQDELWNLRRRDTTGETWKNFDEAWQKEMEKKKGPNLWIAMIKAYGMPYFRGAIFKSASDVLQFIQPQLLRLLITWVASQETSDPQPVIRGAAIALGMFFVSISQTACLHQYFQRSFDTGMRIKSGLTASIYSKAMRLSSEGRATKTTGDIVNYMAVDVQRLQDLTQFGQQLWSSPFQIFLAFASLYQLVGVSFLAGVGVMILMIPINGVIARYMKTLQKRQMGNKDQRTKLMTEILNNMKSIKLYAWTTAFFNKLTHVRNDLELHTLRKIGATQAFTNFAWSTTPFLVSCSTFAVFVLTQPSPLTTDIIFPALTLFNLLTFPLAMLPMVITSVIEATVAVSRLTSYLTADELQEDAVSTEPTVEELGEESVRIRDASFTWNKEDADRVALENISFAAHKGELSCLVGRVGAGKSSLLGALLGDLHKLKGDVVVRGACAYVAQSPWVMNASVRENIVFGHRWDPGFYEKTVKACALSDDFATLPDGDATEVGERGISLSGGQKARVTLARAVYARADVYLLDDVLSAVDQHVGRHLIDNVLGPKGLLASKTRILATNSIPVLMEANFVLLLRDGRVTERGTYQQLMAMKGEIANLIRTANNETQQARSPDRPDSMLSDETVYDEEVDSDEGDEVEVEAAQEGLTTLAPLRSGGNSVVRRHSGVSLRRASTASFRGPRGKVLDEEANGNVKTKQSVEKSEQGKVKWSVYLEYAKTSNLIAVMIYLLTLVAAQTASIGGNVWLKKWAEHNAVARSNDHVGKWLGIYFAFGIGSAALVVVQMLILWIFCSIEASRKLHERMAYAIFRSPMSFFETTPAGRILNRFSSDIYKVDEVLARTFNMLFVNSSRAFFTLIVISFATPAFVAFILPLGGLYLYIQRYYLRTSRELKRLDSVSRSPIYAHFSESLSGLSTIRAYRAQKRFALENEWRVDANLRAYFPSTIANRWLAVRLEFIGSIIILASAGLAIIAISAGKGPTAGTLGLAMSYALQITQSLNWIVRQTVEVETNIVSVERVLEYAALPSEAPEIISKRRPANSWPSQGAVSFENFSARYRPGLDLVLRNVNLSLRPHEKVGVVGRTGAGKSSLTLALFRIIEASEGHISIDNLDTRTIGLTDLRRRLAIIPQDAALFEGTLRDNLDPGHTRDDTELWSALEHARLRDYVASMPEKLDMAIQEAGSNLSSGQRQLVSLARALLCPANVLVLDEATAAVDVETDAAVQATLRSSIFKDRTIITIAHRINTILDSDRVIVLSRGQVAEFDTPAALIKKKGLFYDLVKEANLLNAVEQ